MKSLLSHQQSHSHSHWHRRAMNRQAGVMTNSTVPASAGCPGGLAGFWEFDDFEKCHRQRYLEYYPAALTVAIAVIYTVAQVCKSFRGQLSDRGDSEGLVYHPKGASDVNAEIILRTRSIGDRLRLVLEVVLNIVITAIIAAVWHSDVIEDHYATYAPQAPLAILLLSLYSSACACYRLLRVNQVSQLVGSPFTQQAYLYTVFLFIFGLEWFSQINHPFSKTASKLSAVLLVLSSLNWVILFSSPIGDRAARIYTSNGTIPSMEPTSSLFRIMSCSWNQEMILKAQRTSLEESSVWDLSEDDHVYRFFDVADKLPKSWSFFRRMVVTTSRQITLNILFGIVASVLKLTPTILIQKILQYIETKSVPVSVAWLYVFGLGLSYLLSNVISNQAYYRGRKLSLGVRALIIGSVYKKALFQKVQSTTKKEKSSDSDTSSIKSGGSQNEDDMDDAHEFDSSNTGAVINLMSVDSFKIANFASYLHDVFATPVLIIISIWFLYGIIGWSAFVAVAVMLIIMPINFWVGKKLNHVQDQLMAVTDKRIEKTNEFLGAIRIIKFYAWEKQFTDSILKIREEELRLLLWRYVCWMGMSLLFFLMPIFVVVCSFWSFVRYQGGTLTSSVAFTATSVFFILRIPLDDLAQLSTQISSSMVSVRRIETFLSDEDSPKYELLKSSAADSTTAAGIIGFKNASFTWGLSKNPFGSATDNKDAFKLRDIDLKFKLGDLNLIIGPTGSGKTSLLMALLGEMHLEKGELYMPYGNRAEAKVDPSTGLADTVAYCPQEAWLVNETIKNNILFAQSFDKTRYNAVLDACELRRDLDILGNGDQTLIGDKGIALSGGQKQRVSLARALYSNSKHLILDDCLSAVDSHTAEALYNNALNGPLAFGRTIILVSHNIALTIGKASFVVAVSNGRVVAQGTPSEVANSGHLGDDELVRRNADSAAVSRTNSTANLAEISKSSVEHHTGGPEGSIPGPQAEIIEEDVVDAAHEDEERAVGRVPLTTYITYLSLLSNKTGLFLIAALACLVPFMEYLETWWLKVWSANMGYNDVDKVTVLQVSTNLRQLWANGRYLSVSKGGTIDDDTLASLRFYCVGYIIIGLLTTFSAVTREFLMFRYGVRAARRIFSRLLSTVSRARTRFFDTTPSGRIVNRFSKDIETIDQEISGEILWFGISVVDALQVAIVISYVTPLIIPLAVLVAYLFYLIGTAYLAAARELKRLESVTRSPIFQQFGETLTGSVVIRAYGDTDRFLWNNWNFVDGTHRPYFWLWLSNRWLSFWCSMLSFFICVGAASFLVYEADSISPGMAGISLAFSSYFGDCILWIVRMYVNCEISMNSVERVGEYLEIEQEAPAVIPESRPPSAWPSKGEIIFKDLSLQYSEDLPMVIKNVSFEVPGGKKVGIVGRTGAGKSTIITALFRLLEATTGSITIDQIDISTIGLDDLRGRLSIIPQDPTLFKGSLRSNLDLFNEYSDEVIFKALGATNLVPEGTTPESAAAELAAEIGEENANQFLDLEYEVTEGGKNLSQGQRQLLCLARAILKNPRILLLDEATASIDYETDATIQNTIRNTFDQTTTLTIAHRLRTIADYDLILVLEKGEVAQYDHPWDLLQDKSGIFYSMCEKSGELDVLMNLAKEAKFGSDK